MLGGGRGKGEGGLGRRIIRGDDDYMSLDSERTGIAGFLDAWICEGFVNYCMGRDLRRNVSLCIEISYTLRYVAKNSLIHF